MIESLARHLSTTKRSIVRDATMLGGERMVLPAGLLACATALGLFVEAGSHSAQAYYSEGITGANAAQAVPAAVSWDEPAFPASAGRSLRAEIAALDRKDTTDRDEPGLPAEVKAALGAGDKLGRMEANGPEAGRNELAPESRPQTPE